jgi:hypothetical protein
MDYQEAPQEFFDEVAEKLEGIKAIVQKYGLEDQWVSAFVGGVYTPNEDGSAKLKTILDYVVVDEDELDEILSLAVSYYQQMDSPSIPRELRDTDDWTSEDWMNFIHKNTDKDGDTN